MAGREREIKLAARAPGALEELARSATLAGFALSAVETRDQEDVYLDTEKFLLFSAGASLRYRRHSGILKATLKEIPGLEGRGVLRDRREIEEVVGAAGGLRGAVGDAVASLAGGAKLHPILRLRTRRRIRQVIAEGSAVAELCLDEVDVSPGGEGAGPSARFCEVEVEERCGGSDALAVIGEELLASPDFEPSLLSKLERGLDLLGLLEPLARRPREAPPIQTAFFRIPADLGVGELERRLASRLRTVSSPERFETKTLYDSFDWRIHRHGGSYETNGTGAERVHVWRDAEGRVRHRLRHPSDPGFPADLPPGALRDELAAVLSVRRLLPLVTSSKRIRTAAILDDEEKTTVRLHIESGTSSLPEGSEAHPLESRVRIDPVRGYDAERVRVAGFLRDECGLLPDAAGELACALEPLGRVPGDYTSKFELALDPEMPARDAARAIHLALFDTMRRNEEGTRRDLDSEFLHDFRVAIRRTRSALTQIPGVYPSPDADHFEEEFRWLADATGPTRDLDVYLLKMDAYKEGLPEEVRSDLKPLEEFLERKQRLAHDRLVAALDSERYRTLVEQWRAFLTRPASVAPPPPNAERPIREVASERIGRVYRRMLKRGRAIDDDTPGEALHDLRIRAKKLRYLLEFFRSLCPEREVEGLVADLKRLQDNLGEFNDYRVQRRSLQEFAAEMAEEGSAPVPTQLAMGRLLARLDAGRAAERSQFAERFDRFASRRNRKRLARLFPPGEGR